MSDQSTPGAEITGVAVGEVTPPVEAPVVDTPAPVEVVAPVETPAPEVAATPVIDHLAIAAHTAFLTSAEERVRGVLNSILQRVEKSALIAEVEKLAADLKL